MGSSRDVSRGRVTPLAIGGLCVVVGLLCLMAGIYAGDGLGYQEAIRDVAGRMTEDELRVFREIMERSVKPDEVTP